MGFLPWLGGSGGNGAASRPGALRSTAGEQIRLRSALLIGPENPDSLGNVASPLVAATASTRSLKRRVPHTLALQLGLEYTERGRALYREDRGGGAADGGGARSTWKEGGKPPAARVEAQE
ncbi:hypothetical protein EYF80_059462 [Liparis tanakae]|uniref:Uncharacterized protein n=1 Tax=Liparis tanakae TaxID=230148 RepID=A0A4Z2ENB5_9TELE|nr:hypothetical protein EYF80_059462 [Liparis tanakae]